MNPETPMNRADPKEFSELRTDLSEHQTELSEHRTVLSDVRSHLANERTLLAYQRTGISLISFGVTLNRFSIFLLQNEASKTGGQSILHETKYAGIGMVVLGSAMVIWSVAHYLKTAKVIDQALVAESNRSVLIFSGIVVILGTLTTLWMFLK